MPAERSGSTPSPSDDQAAHSLRGHLEDAARLARSGSNDCWMTSDEIDVSGKVTGVMDRHERIPVGKDLDLALEHDHERTVGTARFKQDVAGFNRSNAAKRSDSLDLRRSQRREDVLVGRARCRDFSAHVSDPTSKAVAMQEVVDMEPLLGRVQGAVPAMESDDSLHRPTTPEGARGARVHVGRERGPELRFVERQKAVLWRQNRWHRRAGGRIPHAHVRFSGLLKANTRGRRRLELSSAIQMCFMIPRAARVSDEADL